MAAPYIYNVSLASHRKFKKKEPKRHEIVQHFHKMKPREFQVYRHIARAQTNQPVAAGFGSHMDVTEFPAHKHAAHILAVHHPHVLAHKIAEDVQGGGFFDWARKAVSFVSRNIPKITTWFKKAWKVGKHVGSKAADVLDKVDQVASTVTKVKDIVRDVTDVTMNEMQSSQIFKPETVSRMQGHAQRISQSVDEATRRARESTQKIRDQANRIRQSGRRIYEASRRGRGLDLSPGGSMPKRYTRAAGLIIH